MTHDQIESLYETLAQGIDRSPEAPEIFLAKLCLALGNRLGDAAAVALEVERILTPPAA